MEDVFLHDTFVPCEPREAALGAGELHVWAVPQSGATEAFTQVLSAAERERAGRFHFADHRRRYEISHGALRRILGGYVDADPAALEFETGPRGKPFLAGTGPFFNLSHSAKLAVVGVGSTELGLDCEKVRDLGSYLQIAEKHFSSDEFRGLSAYPEAERLGAFYRCWVRKEAYIKALGEGLAMALDSFDVTLGEEPQLLACRDRDEDPCAWTMIDVSPGPGFVAAAALRAAAVTVKRFRLPIG